MEFFKSKAAVMSAAFLLATGAAAQEAPAELVYKDSVKCAAFYSLLSVAAEGEEGSEKAAANLDDLATRWLVLAMVRDGKEGDQAVQDIGNGIDQLGERLDKFGEDDAAAEAFMMAFDEKCTELAAENRAEFDAVDVEAINAEAEEAPAE